MTTGENIYESIKGIVKIKVPDARVMLFGSRARKDEQMDSDYDILVVTSKKLTSERKLTLRSSIRKDLLEAGYRADVLVQNEKEIESKRKLPGHIIRNILKDAVVL